MSAKVGAAAEHASLLEARASARREMTDRWVLELRTEQNGVVGERRFKGESCRAVVEALVMTLALAIYPELVLEPPGGHEDEPADVTPEPAPPSPSRSVAKRYSLPSPSPSTSQRAKPAREVARAAPTHLGAFLQGGVHWGAFALARPTLDAGLELERSGASVRVTAGYGPEQTSYLAGERSGVALSIVEVGMSACYQVAQAGQVALAPCAGASWARAFGKGVGVDREQPNSLEWLSGELGALLVWRVEYLQARFGVAVQLPAHRPTAVLDYPEGPREVARLSIAEGRTSAGFGVVF